MNLEVSVRHQELTDNIKEYALQQVQGLSQFWDRIVDGQIVFDKEGVSYMVEIILRVSGKTLTATATEDDIIKSVDTAVQKMERRLKRYKGKLINR